LYIIVDINECMSSPCVHGTCKDNPNGYTCTCNQGYTGTHCGTGMYTVVHQITFPQRLKEEMFNKGPYEKIFKIILHRNNWTIWKQTWLACSLGDPLQSECLCIDWKFKMATNLSEWVIVVKLSNFSAIPWREQVNFQ